jgi:hypothetical protein
MTEQTVANTANVRFPEGTLVTMTFAEHEGKPQVTCGTPSPVGSRTAVGSSTHD